MLNFAVAAYSPLQRLEAFRRKALAFEPDLVLYSATMLDIRLMEIHSATCSSGRLDLHLRLPPRRGRRRRDRRRRPAARRRRQARRTRTRSRRSSGRSYWALYDATLGALAADCRSAGVAAGRA